MHIILSTRKINLKKKERKKKCLLTEYEYLYRFNFLPTQKWSRPLKLIQTNPPPKTNKQTNKQTVVIILKLRKLPCYQIRVCFVCKIFSSAGLLMITVTLQTQRYSSLTHHPTRHPHPHTSTPHSKKANQNTDRNLGMMGRQVVTCHA